MSDGGEHGGTNVNKNRALRVTIQECMCCSNTYWNKKHTCGVCLVKWITVPESERSVHPGRMTPKCSQNHQICMRGCCTKVQNHVKRAPHAMSYFSAVSETKGTQGWVARKPGQPRNNNRSKHVVNENKALLSTVTACFHRPSMCFRVSRMRGRSEDLNNRHLLAFSLRALYHDDTQLEVSRGHWVPHANAPTLTVQFFMTCAWLVIVTSAIETDDFLQAK